MSEMSGQSSGTCEHSLHVLDFQPPLTCLKDNDTSKCEETWPCELRQYWLHIHLFVDFTRGLLLYGTSLIIIFGIILNCFSFYILVSSGLAKKRSGVYLWVLAICDSGNLLFNYAIGVGRGQISELNDFFMRDEWACRIHGVLVDVFQLISAWIVVGFTVERCLVVWYPMALRRSRNHRSKIVVASLCAVFTVFSLSKLFLTGFEKDSVFGYIPCNANRYRWEGMSYVGIAFQTWIPTCAVFSFNCIMFYQLKRVKKIRNRLTGFKPTARKEQDQQSFFSRPSPTTPMLIAVSLAYLVLVFPLGVVQSIELYWNTQKRVKSSTVDPDKSLYIEWMMTKILLKYIRSFCFGLYQLNFTVNFFLYFAAGQQFRIHLLYKLRLWTKYFKLGCSPRAVEEDELQRYIGANATTSRQTSSSIL